MKYKNSSVLKDLVLIGGGHSHVAVLKKFGMRPLEGTRITVLARDIQTPYSGMLPGLVAGHYSYEESHIDLWPLCLFSGARLYHDEATDPDGWAHRREKHPDADRRSGDAWDWFCNFMCQLLAAADPARFPR